MDKQQANMNAARVAGYTPRLISGAVFTGNPYDKAQNAKAFDIFATTEWHEAILAVLCAHHSAMLWIDEENKNWCIQLENSEIYTGVRLADALASVCAEAVEGMEES
ncbi:MAG: hypothetical protein KAR40_11340 [Candidatus Sabulitectum sp.]|nr:hypothetical protein [Candidatus Sabulitectum sp.]